MKNLIQFLLILTSLLYGVYLNAQDNSSLKENKIEQDDIRKFIGEWNGKLTYLDYSSGKSYSIPCDLVISGKRKKKKLALKYTYPNEPKANSKGKIKFSKDRTLINKKRIRYKTTNPEGQTEIVTEVKGKDGNERKKALIRNIYKIGDNDLVIRKEVKFEDSNEWILRNEYAFKKN